MTPLRGVIAAVTTPFDDDLEVHLPRLIAWCRHLLDNGCDGLNLLGTTGEATSLTVAQRAAVMQAIADAKLPLERFMVGTGAAALGDAAALTALACRLGFGGALLLPPFYYKNLNEEEVFGYVAALIERVAAPDLRLYLYNFPQLSGVTYAPATVQRLHEVYPGRLLGLKDSSGDLGYAAGIAARTPIDVFPSNEGTLALMREKGFAGCISATANVTAPLCAAGLRAPSPAEGNERIARAVAIREALAQAPTVPAVKWAVGRLTGDSVWNTPAPPLRALAAAQISRLEESLEQTAFETLARASSAPAGGPGS